MTIHVSTLRAAYNFGTIPIFIPGSIFIDDVESIHSDGLVVSVKTKTGYHSFPLCDAPDFENIPELI